MFQNKPIKIAKDIDAVRRSALWHLSQRDLSEAQLLKKLQRKTDNHNWIETVINECLDNNYLNDQRFCENFIKSAQNKGLGPARIKQALKQKGLHSQIIEDTLINFDFDAQQQLIALLQTKFNQAIVAPYIKQKAIGFLHAKGHSFAVINKAIETFNQDHPAPCFDNLDKACELLSKKFKKNIDQPKQINKALRLLSSHGYDYTKTKQAINKFNQQLTEETG